MAWSFVQSAQGVSNGTATTVTTTLSGVTAGNILVLAAAIQGSTAVSLGAPSGGGTWTTGITLTNTAYHYEYMGLYVCESANGGSTSVSISETGTQYDFDTYLAEFSPGPNMAVSIDAPTAKTLTGSSANPLGPQMTPAGSGELAFSMTSLAVWNSPNQPTAFPASPWTTAQFNAWYGYPDNYYLYPLSYMLNAGSGAVQAQWTCSSSNAWSSIGLFLKATPTTVASPPRYVPRLQAVPRAASW